MVLAKPPPIHRAKLFPHRPAFPLATATVAAPYDAETLSGLFGRKNKKRTEQIEGILETLKGLGQL